MGVLDPAVACNSLWQMADEDGCEPIRRGLSCCFCLTRHLHISYPSIGETSPGGINTVAPFRHQYDE